LKRATVEAGIYFYDLKTVAAKNGFAFYLQLNSKRNLCFKDGFAFALGLPNGLRYPRWVGRRNAVRLEKG